MYLYLLRSYKDMFILHLADVIQELLKCSNWSETSFISLKAFSDPNLPSRAP